MTYEGPLFHVTYYAFLDNISELGLVPSEGYGIGQRIGGWYAHHSSGKLFLTGPGGVIFWHSRLEQHADSASDTPYEDGLTAVVLRLVSDPDDLEDDEIGSRDACGDAYYTRQTIPPDEIEVWAGKHGWIPIEEWDTIDPAQAWTFEENPDVDWDDPDLDTEDSDLFDEDGNPRMLAWHKENHENPLYPPDEALT